MYQFFSHYFKRLDRFAKLATSSFGEAALCRTLNEYVEHYHHERNHQGKGNVLLFPAISQDTECEGPMQCRERLGGLLKYYTRDAA